MRLQLDLVPVDLAPAERFSASQAAAVAKQVQDLLLGAALVVTLGKDRAEVDSGNPDWALLTPEEQAAGGFDYPELRIEGPGGAVVDVFLSSVFLSTDPDLDAEQAATAQVMRVLRAVSPLVVISEDVWRDVEQAAADRQVSVDGVILRPVLSSSEVSARAVRLFDSVRSSEFTRAAPERLAAQLAALGEDIRDLPPFRASIAADPSGSSFGYELPSKPPFTSGGLTPLRTAMELILDAALEDAHEATGIPTGLVVDHDENGTTSGLLFDNLVDSGALNPSRRTTDHRSAPFAWQSITARAAGRDPAFQPTWLPEAIELLAVAGTDVTVNTTSTWVDQGTVEGDPPEVSAPSPRKSPEAPAPSLRDRLRRWFGA